MKIKSLKKLKNYKSLNSFSKNFLFGSNQINKINVKIIGWVHSIRNHGKLIFFDLRENHQLTQIVIDPKIVLCIKKYFDNSTHDEKFDISNIKEEYVIKVYGKIVFRNQLSNLKRNMEKNYHRIEYKKNPFEVVAEKCVIYSSSKKLPFSLKNNSKKINEEIRLKYRYLDLRRKEMTDIIKVRCKVAQIIRKFLKNFSFLELEIPLLSRRTIGGAKEFLVSKNEKKSKKKYALIQSPQQYKQMLMISGIDKYYSFSKCFRNENLRSDRQPEFTQIDIEMAFINEKKIMFLIENMIRKIWIKIFGIHLEIPFKKISYSKAFETYGTDKPDVRYGLKIIDITKLISKFLKFDLKKKVIKLIIVRKNFMEKMKIENIIQKTIKNKEINTKLDYIKVNSLNNIFWSNIFRGINNSNKKLIVKKLRLKSGDIAIISKDYYENSCKNLGIIRTILINQEKSIKFDEKNQYKFLWIDKFPLYSFDKNSKSLNFSHHPFTAIEDKDIPLFKTSNGNINTLKKIKARHYDIVVNGVELGGGSIRINNVDLQKEVLSKVFSSSEIKKYFRRILEAFKYGTPPHGGIALGFDRLISVIMNCKSIRDTILFPKNQSGYDLVIGAPSL
jgi:aspartyl-tRNA synthetase